MPKPRQQYLEELGVKTDHYTKKHKQDTVQLGRYTVVKVSHNEWDIYTAQDVYVDTYPSKKLAMTVAKALGGR